MSRSTRPCWRYCFLLTGTDTRLALPVDEHAGGGLTGFTDLSSWDPVTENSEALTMAGRAGSQYSRARFSLVTHRRASGGAGLGRESPEEDPHRHQFFPG